MCKYYLCHLHVHCRYVSSDLDSYVTFPKELHSYALDEELLTSVFHQAQSGKEPLHWCLQGVPNVGFYQVTPFFEKVARYLSVNESSHREVLYCH